jgi:hypothetical protein
VVLQKYIEPDSLETWIRSAQKSLKGVSVIWKAIVKSFPVIGEGLAWKIGNGHRVRLGADPWAGCEGQHLLPDQLIFLLRTRGFDTLNKLADPDQTTIWSQGWKSLNELGLEEEDAQSWKDTYQA